MSSHGDERSVHLAKVRKRRRWFYILIVPGTIAFAVALAANWAPGWLIPRLRQHGLDFSADQVLFGAFAVALPLLLAIHKIWRCPACGVLLGHGRFCRGCGLALRACQALIGRGLHAPRCGGCGRDL